MRRLLWLAAALIVLAIILAGVGLLLRALRWLLVIAAIVLVAGALLGYRGRGSRTP